MTVNDYRAPVSAAEFDAIPSDDEYPIDDYYERLIAGNGKFQGIERQFPRGYEDIRLIRQLTAGQQLLTLLGIFDGQVKNGGITQFFWNYPECIFDVRDALERLGPPELLANYERALESLVGNKDRWTALRDEWRQAQDNPSWEPFRQTYELLDLAWFEAAYFDQRGYNDRQEWVVQKPGLHQALLNRLADYVRMHRAEFIAE